MFLEHNVTTRVRLAWSTILRTSRYRLVPEELKRESTQATYLSKACAALRPIESEATCQPLQGRTARIVIGSTVGLPLIL